MTAPQTASIRLSDVQLLMRSWSELAPYHFIHTMRIAGAPDVDRWRLATERAVQQLGLGVPEFVGDTVRFSPASPVRIDLPSAELDEHLDTEMNRPFSRGESPLRFFIIDRPDNSHWFGVVIDHWLADDFSCRQLLHGIFRRYNPPDNVCTSIDLTLGSSSPPRRSILAGLLHLMRQFADHRQAFRVPLGDVLDFRVRTFRRTLPDGLIEALAPFAKKNLATIHDVFLVACAQTFGEFRQGRFESKRQDIGMVTPMSLRRRESRAEDETKFGCLLGYFFVVAAQPEKADSSRLLRDTASKTRWQKTKSRGDLGGLKLVVFLWALTRNRSARATLFHRGVPQVCGLSNVNLTGSWIEEAGSRLLDYRRIGPTGPIVPMVFMITTIGRRLSIEVTYRVAAFVQSDAELLADRFIARLNSLAA